MSLPTNHERDDNMPLSYADVGETYTIKGIWADSNTKHSLEKMGFKADCEVVVISEPFQNSLIIGIENKRIAIGKELARKIVV